MSQHDYILDNASGAAFRADLNQALLAIVSNNSGGSAPSVTYPYMYWVDTLSGWLKQRDASNTAWISIYPLTTGINGLLDPYLFYKTDKSTVVFSKTGTGTISIKAGTVLKVNGNVFTFSTAAAVVMPTLTAGTDYAIYICDDGTVRADSNFTSPTGYTTVNSRQIGGFHYAPGGHSGSPGGGNTTPQVNEYSLWDLKFSPACKDQRGMALVADGFWSDIYLLGVDHIANGTSKYSVTIADGSSPPKIPVNFGGNGSTAYGSLTQFEASEVLRNYGKRQPSYGEFAALAYGTTENSAIGTDQGSTIWNAAYVSKWGINQATGVMWIWSDEFAVNADVTTGWNWYSQAGGRGQIYQRGNGYLNAAIFGGAWVSGVNCGSRASSWSYSPSFSNDNIGARGVCDHQILD